MGYRSGCFRFILPSYLPPISPPTPASLLSCFAKQIQEAPIANPITQFSLFPTTDKGYSFQGAHLLWWVCPAARVRDNVAAGVRSLFPAPCLMISAVGSPWTFTLGPGYRCLFVSSRMRSVFIYFFLALVLGWFPRSEKSILVSTLLILKLEFHSTDLGL